ncbi:DUF3216 domain-containing protein [Thermococcus sp. JCM 11816]|uniref:DUF3216 domain-containing protein n=1 Tax=Thermococcus sp. (strain JCM 11816 / KS-1) TaxID=1295125 RepID=UPI000A744083
MVEIPEVEELKALLNELGEEGLLERLDAFVRMNGGGSRASAGRTSSKSPSLALPRASSLF